MNIKDQLKLSNWLPWELCSVYKKKGILQLYPWQVGLSVEGVLEKRNLVYCASTSSGKSFVAEILMLRRIMSTGKMAILVLPYVSICAEKVPFCFLHYRQIKSGRERERDLARWYQQYWDNSYHRMWYVAQILVSYWYTAG